jgi:hypothetical protein
LIALLGMAWAKKPAPVPVPDPAELARVEHESACAPDVPENYQIHTGYASGDEAVAVQEARDDARALALATLCSGKSPVRCEVLVRHLEAWKQPHWNPVSKQACAHVGIRRDYLDDDRGDQQRLSIELRRLGEDIAARVGTGVVWIEVPTITSTGCPAGPAGSSMVAELRNALAAAGTVRIATASQLATNVQLSLDVRGTDVVVSAALQEPRASVQTPLEGFVVPGDLFDLTEANSASCRFDRELGLVFGQRTAPDGRTVHLKLPGDGSYCEGDSIEPTLVVDKPSDVKVFSVSQDGTGYVVWPPPGASGKVDSSVSLGEMVLLRDPNLGDEKLVAVAVPVGATFGTSNPWTTYCKAPGPVTSAIWSKSAALGGATFVVQPYDASACVQRKVPRPLASFQVPNVPVCK